MSEPNNKIPLVAGDYRLEEFDGELLLYHPASTRTVHLNDTASLVWNLCDGKRTIREIATVISDAYAESSEDIQHDVTRTLITLADQGVLSFKLPEISEA